MENKPSIDTGVLAPFALGVFSVLGMLVIFFINRANALKPAAEIPSTETPFRYIYLGTEPGLSTQTPEPTFTPIFLEPPAATEPSRFTATPDLPSGDLPTQTVLQTSTPISAITQQAIISRFDDTYYEIQYDGDWTVQTNVTNVYLNTLHISFETENYALFTFRGQQVIVSFQAGPNLGSMLITLDGLQFEASQRSSQTQILEWRSPVLVLGTHELIVTHLTGSSINLDAIIIPDLSTPTPTPAINQ